MIITSILCKSQKINFLKVYFIFTEPKIFLLSFRSACLLRWRKTCLRNSDLRLCKTGTHASACGTNFQHLRPQNAHERRSCCFKFYPAGSQRRSHYSKLDYGVKKLNFQPKTKHDFFSSFPYALKCFSLP